MPDSNGKLTEDEFLLARRWVKEHWRNYSCPFSGDTNWDIGRYITETRKFSGGSLDLYGPVYPFLVVTCKGCGYSVLLNAIKIGILSPKEDYITVTQRSSR